MMNEIDGIILDVDGTLWDSTEIVSKVWTRAVRENGCPNRTVTADDLRRLFGRPMDVIADCLLPDLTPEHRYRIMDVCCVYEQQALETLGTPAILSDSSDAMTTVTDQEYQEFRKTGIKKGNERQPSPTADDAAAAECPICYPGVQATIRRLSGRVPVFIVSNCQAGYIELFLEKTGLGAYVKDFECYGNTGNNKDENIRLLVARNALKNPIYVGDTQGDSDAAETAGVPFGFAKYGFGTANHAMAEIGTFSELEKFAPKMQES
ncbi:MAG: HAD-IA family hydrolase [Lachnospiraceae bacterium]|nr:HAD-IA family hydrolase [Lachnospiraceae bacterium]